MRFTRLRLNGFKSFVDPTDLVIADGLTGVVGPNGCGKSNLLEALRWVMGENRPTAMRGGGMEDVIFAGASTRPARNFAEVQLVLDNSDRLAPAGFNDLDTLEVIRRITRDAGSAYKVNAKDARARDVQMLFADASTGAHSPALVRQGQISELINAKPQARRRILEEAAGISGLYQRRHEAELKLKGAETNLTRVDDVIEQLAGQIATLARQAKQAARYREVGKQLHHAEGLLLYLRWREAENARIGAETALAESSRLAAEAERLARQATGDRAKAEEALPPLREEEAIAAAVLARLQLRVSALSEEEDRATKTITTLESRIAQLTRDADRESDLNADAQKTLTALTEEEAELTEAGDGQEAALETAHGEAQEAARILQDQETAHSQLTEDVARLAARHQSAERLASDARKTLERSEAAEARAKSEAASARADLEKAEAAFGSSETTLKIASDAASAAEAALTAADEARETAQAKEADARAGRSAAEGEVKALQAEVAALAKLVDRDTAEGGQVMDLLSVKSGYEKALGAALADDLRAPVIEGDSPSGWAALPNYSNAQTLPEGVASLNVFVNVPEVLARRISQVGLVEESDGPELQAALKPGQRLVSKHGSLWRWDGFRAGAGDAPSAAALRLEQMNRLQELKQDLVEATARADGAAKAHDLLKAEMDQRVAQVADARNARKSADHALTEANRALSRLEADRNISAGKREAADLAVNRHGDEATAARTSLAQAETALGELDDLATLRAKAEDIKMTVEAARMTMMAKRSAHDELKREGEARARRLTEIAKERGTWDGRLQNADTRMAELAERRATSEAELSDAQAVPGRLAEERAALAGDLEKSENRRAAAADALALGETAERDAKDAERDSERHASEAREARAAAGARFEATRETVAQAAERIAEDQETTPDALLESLDADPEQLPSAEKIEADVARLRRSRDALGAVNLRAEEDAREVEEEHATLINEKTDLEEAIRTLRAGIASLNKEGRERLLEAFDQVNNNFSMLFKHLFGGGEAKLVLVESDDPLEAGLEIMCQPPGKKLSTLSLLSGGEQTLTALALIFAVFLANPAPICVLDEVDAPLDDANVTRFCDLLDEMCRRTETRFLIITHHAVTMARMDRLFGVTMGEQGVSQLVSVDLKKAEALVA
ncbi:MAG: chromosome segregation protein SMC [Silicimonas sp.]|nr:chromosome segregation protein SMC [Silicimonas sp.]